jgi:hypothetical protein
MLVNYSLFKQLTVIDTNAPTRSLCRGAISDTVAKSPENQAITKGYDLQITCVRQLD